MDKITNDLHRRREGAGLGERTFPEEIFARKVQNYQSIKESFVE